MSEKLYCAIDDIGFGGVDPRLYLEDITEEIRMRTDTASNGGRGLRLLGAPEREGLAVTLRFMVKERDRAARARVISRVNAWAKEGWLTVSTRPDQRLYAVCTRMADSETYRWSGDMQLTLTACGEACWQDRYPTVALMNGSAGETALRPLGTRACPLEAAVMNLSGETVNALSLTANGQRLAFEGLGLAAGETLEIACDQYGLLTAAVNGAGRLDRRTADSADILTLTPGKSNAVGFTADGTCGVTLYARGRYD